MSNRIIFCGLGGGLFGILCTGAFFWFVSVSGYLQLDGNFFKNTPNGNVNYIEDWGCTVDMRKDTNITVAKELFEFCIEHHQKFLNKQQ